MRLGVHNHCKACCKKRNRKRYLEKKEYFANLGLMYRYGLSYEQVEQAKKDQGNRCAICGVEAKLFVDHCHTTGNLRSLICRACNLSLGFIRDDLRIAKNMVRYLQKHEPT